MRINILFLSVMKALTSAVALQELGPEYRFVTEVRYTGEITNEGVLKAIYILLERVIHI